jgi:transposase
MIRDELENLSKEELIEAYLALQETLVRPRKTSRTSSNPPSSDKKKNRGKSKPGGGKKGHKGHARQLAENPDRIVDHRPEQCSGCGKNFDDNASGTVIGAYDFIDIPPVVPIIERHRRMSCSCPHCGVSTKAPVPAVAGGSPFSVNIQALAVYLKQFQHLSYQRLQQLFADLFGLEISQGALTNMFERSGAVFGAAKEGIVSALRRAQAVASDETGVRIEGVNAYHWVFRSQEAVVHEAAFSRGAKVVQDVMGDHSPDYWLSDRYSAQQNHAKHHQTCLAHLARDAARVLEVGEARVGLALKQWITDAFALARNLVSLASSTIKAKRRALDKRIATIVAATTGCEETRAVLKKFANARDQLLIFATAPPGLVEATNNGCERDLRPAVIHRKVTNGFRAFWAAQNDCAVRTVIDTGRLNGLNPYQTIRNTLGA